MNSNGEPLHKVKSVEMIDEDLTTQQFDTKPNQDDYEYKSHYAVPSSSSSSPSFHRMIKALQSAMSSKRWLQIYVALTEMVKYSFRQTMVRSKLQYCIGCSSVFLVVFTVGVLVTVLSIAPIVNLTIGEYLEGEVDLVIRANPSTSKLNYTLMKQQLESTRNAKLTRGTPRIWDMANQAYSYKSCKWSNENTLDYLFLGPEVKGENVQEKQSLKSQCQSSVRMCVSTVCPLSEKVSFWAIDSKRERELDLGRSWKLARLSNNSAYISARLADVLGLSVGDTIILSLNIQEHYPLVYNRVMNLTGAFTETNKSFSAISHAPFEVKGTFTREYSTKLPLSLKSPSIVVVEYSQLFRSFAPYLDPSFPLSAKLAFSQDTTSMYEEVSSVAFSCGTPRYECYLESIAFTATKIFAWASDVVFAVGFSQVTGEAKLVGTVNTVAYFGQFLILMGSIIVILLIVLSIFLIYNLMMGSVETKTFELGVLRMIGLPRRGTMLLLLIQAMSYAIPAWVIGLSGAQGAFFLVRKVIEMVSNVIVSWRLSLDAILWSTALGLFIPMISAILPIRKALGNNLRDSLDRRASKTKAIIITIKRNNPGSLAGTEPLIASGIILIVAGFVVYYLLPLALLDQNIPLLFNIFFGIILGLLFGMVMLATNMQPVMERCVIWVLFDLFLSRFFPGKGGLLFFENRAIPRVLGKNLLAHKMRNKKTTTTLSFALGFIMFLTSNLSVQLFQLRYRTIQSTPCDFMVYVEKSAFGSLRPNLRELDAFFQSNYPYVQDYSWVSQPLFNILSDDYDELTLETQARLAKYPINVLAVSPNYLENQLRIDKNLMNPGEMHPDIYNGLSRGDLRSMNEGLYAGITERPTFVSTFFKTSLAIAQEAPSAIQNQTSSFYCQVLLRNTKYSSPPQYKDTLIEPIGFMDTTGFSIMSNYPLESSRTDILVSPATLLQVTQGVLTSVNDIPIQAVLVYLDNDKVDSKKRKLLYQQLQYVATGLKTTDLRETLESISSSSNLLTIIFQIATALIMLITLFSLNICMMVNIWEQKMEIGVLRALGLKRWGVYRLYVYEAFVIVTSSAFLVMLIGVGIGWTMSIQQSVQSSIPLYFPFPTDLAILVVICAIFSALISTSAPMYGVVGPKQKIVTLLKG